MSPIGINQAADDHRADVLNTITLGFSADPVARWIWPKAETYLATMPRFIDAFGGRGFEHGTIYETGCQSAAAMWLPPGEEPDSEVIEQIMGTTIPEARMEEIGGFFEQMDRFHPQEPCWYLPLIAADPHQTGRGLGAALMKHALSVVDAAGMPAYLESSNPRNISLYERHGFEVIGEIQVGNSPVMTPMFRATRS